MTSGGTIHHHMPRRKADSSMIQKMVMPSVGSFCGPRPVASRPTPARIAAIGENGSSLSITASGGTSSMIVGS